METESPECARPLFRKSQETPMKWKSSNNYHDSPKSSLLFSAQARSFEKKIKHVKKVKNPFAPDDPTIFEGHTCSPGLLQIGPEPEGFSLTIDEIAVIRPADIGSPPVVEEEYDEEQESIAQEAIQKYFSFTHSITTPENAYSGKWRSPASSTPSRPSTAHTTPPTPVSRVIQKFEASTQTKYSFPPDLPAHIEELLKPYICNIEEQTNFIDAEEVNLLNTSTLRRKLFFNKGGDDVSPVKFNHQLTPSPVKDNRSRVEWSSEKRERTTRNDSAPSSPDLSPIKSDMSLGSPDISSIYNGGEISMVTVGSLAANDETEEMAVSADDHHRIFSSTVMNKEGTSSGNIESGYTTNSYTYDV